VSQVCGATKLATLGGPQPTLNGESTQPTLNGESTQPTLNGESFFTTGHGEYWEIREA